MQEAEEGRTAFQKGKKPPEEDAVKGIFIFYAIK